LLAGIPTPITNFSKTSLPLLMVCSKFCTPLFIVSSPCLIVLAPKSSLLMSSFNDRKVFSSGRKTSNFLDICSVLPLTPITALFIISFPVFTVSFAYLVPLLTSCSPLPSCSGLAFSVLFILEELTFCCEVVGLDFGVLSI